MVGLLWDIERDDDPITADGSTRAETCAVIPGDAAGLTPSREACSSAWGRKEHSRRADPPCRARGRATEIAEPDAIDRRASPAAHEVQDVDAVAVT